MLTYETCFSLQAYALSTHGSGQISHNLQYHYKHNSWRGSLCGVKVIRLSRSNCVKTEVACSHQYSMLAGASGQIVQTQAQVCVTYHRTA